MKSDKFCSIRLEFEVQARFLYSVHDQIDVFVFQCKRKQMETQAQIYLYTYTQHLL